MAIVNQKREPARLQLDQRASCNAEACGNETTLGNATAVILSEAKDQMACSGGRRIVGSFAALRMTAVRGITAIFDPSVLRRDE